MPETLFPSLADDLSDDPLHAEVQAVLAGMIERGEAPKDAIDAAFATTTALSIDVSGMALTAIHLMRVGATLAQASPELRDAAAQFSLVLESIGRHLSEPGARGVASRH